MLGASFAGKHRIKKFDPRLQVPNSGVQNSFSRIRVPEVQRFVPDLLGHPKPSLTKPIIPIFLMFNPLNMRHMQNMWINPAHAAKHRKISDRLQKRSPQNGKCETCQRSARETLENREELFCQTWFWMTWIA